MYINISTAKQEISKNFSSVKEINSLKIDWLCLRNFKKFALDMVI